MKFGPNDEWTAEMSWDDEDRNGPSELKVRLTDPRKRPSGGISQTVLREIDLAGAVSLVRAIPEGDGVPQEIDWEKTGAKLIDLSAGGINDNDEYLAALSWAYSSAANSPKPVEKLAEVTGKSIATIKSHLWHATRNGFLERSPGRAGGAVTVKAVEVLSQLADKVDESA